MAIDPDFSIARTYRVSLLLTPRAAATDQAVIDLL